VNQTGLAVVALAAIVAGCVPSTAAPAGNAPQLFLPELLESSGKFTLTPGFSPDGRTMVFAQTQCVPIWECPQRLMRMTRDENGWSKPERIGLPDDARVDYPSITPDGRTLLFSWAPNKPIGSSADVSENFDLWMLSLSVAGATPKIIAGPDLNRIRTGKVRTLRFVNNETAPNLTRDGDLYFWSERLDAIGERDVFVARADGRGGFLKPEPLPAPINSPGRDDGAWVSPDGKTMLITYGNRGGCGGNDLFISRRSASGWSQPKNLGCDVNSAADELAGTIMPGSRTLVFASTRQAPELAAGTVALWSVAFVPEE
jgi:WD40-like Beta Propeller Repeat